MTPRLYDMATKKCAIFHALLSCFPLEERVSPFFGFLQTIVSMDLASFKGFALCEKLTP